MSTFARYVTRVFAVHVLMTFAGFVALSQVFDLLSNAEDLARDHGEGVGVLARYALLRLPGLAAFLLPFCVLVGTLTAFGRLARQNEVVMMRAVGLPLGRLPVMLLPALLVVGAVHLLLADVATPRTARALAEWRIAAGAAPRTARAPAEWRIAAEAARAPPERGASPEVWLRSGGDVVGFTTALDGGRRLGGFRLFERDAEGNLVAETTAARAVYRRDGWTLLEGARTAVAGGGALPAPFAARPWPTRLTPERVVALALPPETLSAADLLALRADRLGYRPDYVYTTYFYHGLLAPLVSFLMVLLATPVAQAMGRFGGFALGATVGIALGFVYFLSDGLLVALGAAGVLPPALAAGGAFAVFLCVAGAGLARAER